MEKLLPAEAMAIVERFKESFSNMNELVEYKGVRFPPTFSAEAFRYAVEEWDIPERTVFVASYPKTGNHWCVEIANQILNGRDERIMEVMKYLPRQNTFYLERGPTEKYKLFDYISFPLVLTTHVSEEIFDFEKVKKKNGKVIYVIRNPKDQLVSFYQFSKQFVLTEEMGKIMGQDWNAAYNNEIYGILPQFVKKGENYPDHILGWLKHKDDKDFLLLVYEDMKKDLKKEVARIAQFLEVQLTDEEVAAIADACTFTSMKKKVDTEEGRAESRSLRVMRKGEVGGWKEHFTVTQSEQMDKQIEKKLGHTGIKFTYEL